jgi:phospholipase D1/2
MVASAMEIPDMGVETLKHALEALNPFHGGGSGLEVHKEHEGGEEEHRSPDAPVHDHVPENGHVPPRSKDDTLPVTVDMREARMRPEEHNPQLVNDQMAGGPLFRIPQFDGTPREEEPIPFTSDDVDYSQNHLAPTDAPPRLTTPEPEKRRGNRRSALMERWNSVVLDSGFASRFRSDRDTNGDGGTPTTERPKRVRTRSESNIELTPAMLSPREPIDGGAEEDETVQPLQSVAAGGPKTKRRISLAPDSIKNLRKIRQRFTRKRKPVNPEDYKKSTELVNELMALAPAAMILAGALQRDEKNMRKVPVLLEQIRLKVVPAQEGRRFRVELEYGSGPARLSWYVIKDYKEFSNLHARLKAQNFKAGVVKSHTFVAARPSKLPRLPKPTSNWRRPSLGDVLRPQTSLASVSSGASRRPSWLERRVSHLGVPNEVNGALSPEQPYRISRFHSHVYSGGIDEFAEELCDYLKQLLHLFRFRVDSNKLLQFFELSNMSIKLASENSYHGKEGALIIRTRAGDRGWRVSHWRPEDLAQMVMRHTYKWVMVRHSYILVVDSMIATDILEVFLVDSGFTVSQHKSGESEDKSGGDSDDERSPRHTSRYSFTVENNERLIKFSATQEKEISTFVESIQLMKENTPWSRVNRFDSFAPVRKNVYARWFVDGRDYFWALSEALEFARDCIYIMDWWLSPELYLRRPPEGNQKWRLDRVLKRKAAEGVKIFVIVYRNVGQTVPIDSMYTKHSLLDLHENIHVMRSPNQLLQNTFFWAHHEKTCIIDHTIAFVGGIDLCFGRWDTPQHVLVDDAPKAFYDSAQEAKSNMPLEIWPGKDYSNPRVKDFYELSKPFEDMYDRQKVPRMPWHDIHSMVLGQPARDLARHFVQRWNYVLRQKRPSRFTPLLIPPPDFTHDELQGLRIQGTLEYQILRSSSKWSIGVKTPEHSIQNAYLKAIEESEHLVYIENQFFITSTVVDGTRIENHIGDALVERIMRADKNGEDWKAIIVIPLMPGFESQVDEAEGSSVRLIMQCQYLSISIGPHSIFARLEAAGIHPDDYIQFFSLRKWGKIGPNKSLVTEQLYIHAKTMVVDDRIAIIGSANINERSMRGIRDSELACFVRDSHQLDSHMGGRPYRVGKFPHTLRMRLMREHLGVDMELFDVIAQNAESLFTQRDELTVDDNLSLQSADEDGYAVDAPTELHSFNYHWGEYNLGLRDKKAISKDSRVQDNPKHREDVNGHGADHMADRADVAYSAEKQREDSTETLLDRVRSAASRILASGNVPEKLIDFKRRLYEDITGADTSVSGMTPEEAELPDDTEQLAAMSLRPIPVNPFSFEDPLDENFYYNTWQAAAIRNTEIFRHVFRCQPDDDVLNWKEYMDYVSFGKRFAEDQMSARNSAEVQLRHDVLGERRAEPPRQHSNMTNSDGNGGSQNVDEAQQKDADVSGSSGSGDMKTSASNANLNGTVRSRRRRKGLRLRHTHNRNMQYLLSKEAAEGVLEGVTGNLVQFPAYWLCRELESDNWFYNADRMPPLEIYD